MWEVAEWGIDQISGMDLFEDDSGDFGNQLDLLRTFPLEDLPEFKNFRGGFGQGLYLLVVEVE